MFLKSLKIECDERIIREIAFHKGINLIVDETPSTEKESGNNVGKTTVLRLINFCLGGKGKSIYQEPEFTGRDNEEVKSFLTDNAVMVTLTLVDSLDEIPEKQIVIRRNFLARNKKILEINSHQFKASEEKEFAARLNELIFASSAEKPSFRQLIAKNIRDEEERLNNTLKVLKSATLEVYESIYLFLLGIPWAHAKEKELLKADLKVEETIQKRLNKEHSSSEIQQALIIINRNIAEFEVKKDSFNINENYEADLAKLNRIKAELNDVSSELSRLDLRRELILESQTDLEQDRFAADTSQIKALYAQAEALIPNLQKSFEETVNFHNQMITEKVKFITQELPRLEQTLLSLKNRNKTLLVEEKQLGKKLKKAGAIDELQEIINELMKEYERKGHYEEKIELLRDSQEKKDLLEEKLDLLKADIVAKDLEIEGKITKFNEFFSSISHTLYGEDFLLAKNFDKKKGCYKFEISSTSGRLGTGKKKGEIAAFDLAYVQYADSLGKACPHFILHDQLEVVHGNQILGLLSVINQTNCQFIVPALRDKLPSELLNQDYQVLSLSQDDKLFRV